MLRAIVKWLTGGVLDRVLDTVDRRIVSVEAKERIKGEVLKEHLRTRADYLNAGGFWLMLLFAAPLALWFGAVCVYSVLWCAGCAFPQEWTIAALPAPLGPTSDGLSQGWAGIIITSICGVVGLARLKR